MKAQQVRGFQKKIYDYYQNEGRVLPWRKRPTPYRVLVSEVMLQQTQVERVVAKLPLFLSAFPGFADLANAPLQKLLSLWSGMGYNRRALSLQAAAKIVVQDYRGRLPRDRDALLSLPGIGAYTAGAIMAFAFDQPVVFMDTNIRRVYLHEFFQDQDSVHDREILPFVGRTLDVARPRVWYNALMDYGAMLGREHPNPNRRSAHYVRQAPFAGSNRELRGRLLKTLVAGSPLTLADLLSKTAATVNRVRENLDAMEREGLIRKTGSTYSL